MSIYQFFLRGLCMTLAVGHFTAFLAVGQSDVLTDDSVQAVVQALHDGEESFVDPANCNCELAGSCGSCGSGGGLDLGLSNIIHNPGQFYFGGEYLSIRSTFSENNAFIQTDTDNVTASQTTTFVPLSFDYTGSYRLFGGYRVPDCGCEIEFAFTNFSSDGSVSSAPLPAVPPPGTGVTTAITTPSGDIALTEGDVLTTSGSVDAQSFDLGFSRTIPLGSPPCGCDCGSACGDSCGDSCCGWCPAWDITWRGGLRYADVDWRTLSTVAADPINTGFSTTALDFNGFGVRFGLEGRRYVGRDQWLSFFIKGDISLLLGDLSVIQTSAADTGNVAIAPTVNTARISTTQIVPVTDIVIGADAQVTPNATVSIGYLLSAWHDLGNRSSAALDGATAIPGQVFDDANILGFDGFFIRAERTF